MRARAARDARVLALGWAIVAFAAVLLVMLAASALGWTQAALALPTGLVVASVVGFARDQRSRNARAHRRQLYRSKTELAEVRAFVSERLTEIEGYVRLTALDAPYPLPFGGWSVTPDSAVILAEQVAMRRPGLVVELGSGVTTLVLGLILRRAGHGRVVALEHEPAWADRTRRHIAALGLEEVVDVVDAPLVPYEIGGSTYRWYTLPTVLRGCVVDFVLVDGPPQNVDREGLPRYPALPLLADQLAPDAALFVDDAKRAAEKQMVERWTAEFPGWKSTRVASRKGTIVVERQAPAELDGRSA